ncbi:unnamed protein product, partial [Rotaria sp. Silwood1]
ALIYTNQVFIDKSLTVSHWGRGLDPYHPTLLAATRKNMLHYAIYDCFATTYLARPVLEYWSFQKIVMMKFFVNQSVNHATTNDVYEPISDDDDEFNVQLQDHNNALNVNKHSIVDNDNNNDQSVPVKRKSRHQNR